MVRHVDILIFMALDIDASIDVGLHMPPYNLALVPPASRSSSPSTAAWAAKYRGH